MVFLIEIIVTIVRELNLSGVSVTKYAGKKWLVAGDTRPQLNSSGNRFEARKRVEFRINR